MKNKYNIGDVVFILRDNTITKGIICSVSINVQHPRKGTINEIFNNKPIYSLIPVAESIGAENEPIYSTTTSICIGGLVEDRMYDTIDNLLSDLSKNAKI